MGHKAHVLYYERGATGGLGNVMPVVIENESDGTIPIKSMESYLLGSDDDHIVPIKAISIESSAMNVGGRALKPEYFSEVKKLAKKKKERKLNQTLRRIPLGLSKKLSKEAKDLTRKYKVG